MFKANETLFVLVDVQGKLSRIDYQSDIVLKNMKKLIKGLHVLNVPVIWLEQYPEGLGGTAEEIAEELKGYHPIKKMNFNACRNETFMEAIRESDRRKLLIAGLESHVCVYQTAMGLQDMNLDVSLVKDAVSSRKEYDRDVGIQAMEHAGIKGTSVEMLYLK